MISPPKLMSLALLCLFGSSCAATGWSPPPTRGHGSALPVRAQGATSTSDRSVLEFGLGGRVMADNDWDVDSGDIQIDLSAQNVFHFGSYTIPTDGSVGLEWSADIATASDKDTVSGEKVELKSTTIDLGVGARKSFVTDASPIAPYVGAGISAITTLVEATGDDSGITVSNDDSAAGIYVHTGVNFFFSESMSLGLDYRLTTGANYIDALDGSNANNSQLLFMLGFSN